MFTVCNNKISTVWVVLALQKFLTQAESGKISPKIFSLLIKKISSDWVKKYQGQRMVGHLITASQKYARVRVHTYSSVTLKAA